jgi:hypothetical protein
LGGNPLSPAAAGGAAAKYPANQAKNRHFPGVQKSTLTLFRPWHILRPRQLQLAKRNRGPEPGLLLIAVDETSRSLSTIQFSAAN